MEPATEMSAPDNSIERRLHFASGLVLAGLAIQLGTLFWNHPLAFLAFMFVGSPFVAAGVLLYLTSIVQKS